MLEQDHALAHQGDRGVKLMGLPAQQLELLARGRAVGGLGKSPFTERERLVGTEHDPAGQTSGNRMCFFTREQCGDLAGIARRTPLLDRTLVDVRGTNFDCKPGCAQDLTPDGALRRQHQRSIGEPKRHHSRKRLAAAFGEKAHHRRCGLLDRSPRHVDAGPIMPGAQLA